MPSYRSDGRGIHHFSISTVAHVTPVTRLQTFARLGCINKTRACGTVYFVVAVMA